jgi:hypothetical protein
MRCCEESGRVEAAHVTKRDKRVTSHSINLVVSFIAE